ncbi:phenylalanine--tRNA ligase subunit alpha [Patescibacteria group bacterium]|nr:phenylalanine--tRNA ligase subunit alpha [Patescibacteria group bacterium]MBU1563833.1 phenylalanine--tRNA ligase subunit alpha [Patescibacteria group bacterium]MBU2068089.1 phenylalanine--tRNA ligase subunit alpha [Patescibacteria group bacterium]
MTQFLNKLKQDILNKIKDANNLKTIDEIYRAYLGRKGELTKVLRSIKDMPEKERIKTGKLANQVKKEIEEVINAKKSKLQTISSQLPDKEQIDVTIPGLKVPRGHLHPITLVQREVEEIFQSMGFSILDGPEVETAHYHFDALNIPKDHPARDVWDTFWLKDFDLLLRAQTSPMQVRYMEKNNPPLRIIVPGRCFRRDATDSTHDFQFHQFEGLMVGEDISTANFKAIVEEFFKRFFSSSDIQTRLRPSYFPFVEPGFEVDVKRKGNDWLEIMGAGMVHPNVFKAVGYNLKDWQGFAFGAGIERLAMIKYQIDDIRLFFNSDLRFLKQF